MPLKGRSFGQERPPLTDLLKNILLRYPDGGQILKEIIQNADDAGASEVRFLFDATSYGTSSLVSPGLACFQGPALYCYNNAVFTEEDWEGLQSLMRSKKKDNPLKVGRFGIGFNSVYHITDLPSIVSGETVAFLDPHEKYFVRGQPGQAFSTDDPLLVENYDQFEPFHKIFDCNLSQGNYFQGTLFRFPLRTGPSQLSNKLYTKAMVQSLFESFKNEANVILHFLKTVDCISLYERENRGELSHLYTIKISEKTKSEVQKKRKELTANITSDWNFAPKSVFYTLEIEEQRQRKVSQKKKWFIANQVGTESEELAALGKELQLLPWVGVSFPIDTKDLAEFSGRIFCFLPLPPDADCRTGLPVQVNGYFGLTDNRRALKWPGPDCLNDDTARWNQLLMREVGSRVYASLIKNLILSGPVVPELASHAQLVYSAFPQIRNVKHDWHCLLEPFCRKVLTEAIFYTAAHSKAKWIRLAEAIVDRLDDAAGTSKEVKDVVLSTLLRAGQPVVTLPKHVLEMVDVYSRKFGWVTVGKVTPHLLRDVLRSNDPRNSSMSVQEKLLLLEYVLQDTPGDSADLHGVPLLPLENGEFCKFQQFSYSSSSVKKIFVASGEHKLELLPNAKHLLLRDDLPRGLKQKMIQLIGITHPSCFPTQLFHLARNDVTQLLWQSLPADWSTDQQTVAWTPGKKCHPSIAWLQMVWVWLAEQYPTNLSEFERMPLIPVSFDSHGTRLARLSRNSTVILAKHSIFTECLPSTVQQFLTACDCVVVQQLPDYLKHNQILAYVAPPIPTRLLKVLFIARKNVHRQLRAASHDVKFQLRSILSKLKNIPADQLSFLLALPIFQAVDGKSFIGCHVDGVKLPVASRNFFLPEGIQILDRKRVISSSEEESFRLLKKLGMRIETTGSLLMPQLQRYLTCPAYSEQEKNKLMLWILERMEILGAETENFTDFLRQLPFVATASGRRKAPRELFDHSDQLLSRLLIDYPDAFPAKEFSEPMKKRKSDLQFRCRSNLTAQDLLKIINVNSSPGNTLIRGNALLELIKQRSELLDGNGLLIDGLRNVAWLPRVMCRPNSYPEFVPWYDGKSVCEPKDMCPSSVAALVGASVPLFDENILTRKIQDSLGLSRNVKFSKVVEQLQLAIVSWNSQQHQPTGMPLAKFQDLLKKIYYAFSQKPANDVRQFVREARLSEWVWHSNGFTSPDKVALLSRFPKSINLHPHLFLLPEDFHCLKEFLFAFGVKKEFTDNDLLSVLRSIKAKHDNAKQNSQDVIQDLDLCRAVLEWLVRDGKSLSEYIRSNLLVPVDAPSGQLRLELCNECTYCDREFLRQGGSESNFTIDSHLIHKAIPDHLASSLDVPRLSSCLAGAQPLGYMIEEAGQYEPITTRIRNILQQYKEGVAIFKEIIQNADDAGASKVCFVVDWRESPRKKLLSDELAKCQGPALWAYNNAMFSKNDFENINKLAGETKKEELDKVGRFGLGFNAVYHLTDVPSFISGENFVVFDPNIYHIAKVFGRARGSRPGMKINLATSRQVLSLFPDQFLPYNDLFGCNTMTSEPGTFHFEGTLFRFPFRTDEQARRSELSENPYTKDHMRNVLDSLKENASTLLLFAQNVKKVRVFEIPRDSHPINALGEPIISISKEVETLLYSNCADRDGKGTFIRNCSNWFSNQRNAMYQDEDAEGPRRTELLKISVSVKESMVGNTIEAPKQQDTWLVNSCYGSGASLRVAESENGRKHSLLPITGAAVKISHSKPVDEFTHESKVLPVTGEVFCFMPLSIASGLPVHVNGYFSVYSNRRRLWEEGVGERQSLKPFEALWNEALMEDALAQVYLQLLELIKSHAGKQYVFHSLWPNPTAISNAKAWKPFINAFFKKIINEQWALFYCNKEWRALANCYILDAKLSKVSECLSIMNILGVNVLSLPEVLLEAFRSSGKADVITQHTLTEEKFLRHFFFPHIARLPNELRDSVLCHVLDRRLRKHRDYDDLLKKYPCFSCSKDGKLLRRPSELVHPDGKVACLFSDEEKKFPTDARFLTKERAMMLQDLGMIVDRLSWDGVCGRAEWISSRCNKERQRASHLVHYLNQSLQSSSDSEPTMEQKGRLSAARFLPFLKKPQEYPFSNWKASELTPNQLVSANILYTEHSKLLVGASQLILDESSQGFGPLNRTLKSILGLNSKEPQLPDVLIQLDHVINHPTLIASEKIQPSCSTMYGFFQKMATLDKHKSKRTCLRSELERRSWMLVKGQMITPKRVAMVWDKADGSPYLFSLPYGYRSKYPGLIKWYGVKEKFTLDDFLQAIWKLREDAEGKKLSDQQLKVVLVFLEEVCGTAAGLNLTNLKKPLPLPSSDGVLYDATELAMNDAPWIETDGSIKYVHATIPQLLAYTCGAKELRSAVLSHNSMPMGQPFGQCELLTDRLNGILKSYPPDEGILKELVQNADDAIAKEIHFVFDPRSHGSQRIFSNEWKELQGPAICVYNDQPFSKVDIQGIQNLGIGSKLNDAEKTGQYGIGFNAVYHLTDCPCFISDDNILCVSDPHRFYVPGATAEKPGRLFNLDDKFRKNFREVFNGFLGEFFSLRGGTMFRFPLRRDGGFQSKISKNSWSESKIRDLLKMFRHSAKEMLLFLNNVTKISISEIKNGKLETYSVQCAVSLEEERREFSEKIKQYKKTPTHEIPRHVIHYTMNISDTNKVKQDWLVSQSLGCIESSNDSIIPDGSKMGLLPRAGIAARLPLSDSSYSPVRYRAFCFLPLPVTTNLQVHVNGHFALDSARRDLWHDPKIADDRMLWNEFMKRQVVAPAYANLIYEARGLIQGLIRQESDRRGLFITEKEADLGLKWYHELFPNVERVDAKWKAVAEALYIDYLPNFSVLPVAQSVPERKNRLKELSIAAIFPSSQPNPQEGKPVRVDWYNVSEVFFCPDNQWDSWSLEKSLLDVGIPLLSHTPGSIQTGFGEKAKNICPESVTEFLRSRSPLKDQLPRNVKDTALLVIDNVYALTKYCSKGEGFFENLDGVPLLLTRDEMLRCFSVDASVFCSRFSQLVPSNPELFLHDEIRTLFVSDVNKCSSIVKEFDIPHLSKFKNALFPSTWSDSITHQAWDPSAKSGSIPSKEWLELLWDFIHDVSSKKKESDVLQSISTWPIIPTTQSCLVPVSMSKTVLNVSSFLNTDSIVDGNRRRLLAKLGCSELQKIRITSRSSSSFVNSTGSEAVLKHYLALVQSAKDVLGLLDFALNKNGSQAETNLSDQEIEILLMFLQSDVSSLPESLLLKLPFYQTIGGKYTRLSSCRTVYEVPNNLPLQDIQVLADIENCVFLRQAPKLGDLYKYIGIQQASSVHFYLRIVLKYFNHLTPVGREAHLKYIRDYLLPVLRSNQQEYNQLISALQELPFIPDHSGALHRACEFYDPQNEVFSAFVPKEKFPQKPFDSKDWEEFLHKVGLQSVVTEAHFLEYATRVQREVCKPHRESTRDKELSEMSQVLVSYLFENTNLHNHQFLSQISKITFVTAAKIKNIFLQIHPAYIVQTEGSRSKFIMFNGSVTVEHATLVWSSAPLLSIANLVMPFGVHREDLVKKLGIHTKPPHELVVAHAQNISGRLHQTNEKQVPPNLRFTLSNVMGKLYDYFKKCCKKSSSESNCSVECTTACNALRDVPVILVDEHTLVRGNQLSFHSVSKTIEPYMFEVPRHLSQYEHFLKCLGAQEYPTPLQYATVLQAIKDGCEDKKMHPGESSTAFSAMIGLFLSLNKAKKPSQGRSVKTFDQTQSLVHVAVLYLPTQDDFLKESTKLLVNDTMEQKDRLKEHWKNLLVDFTIKDQDPLDKLVELLPVHLKVQKLSHKVSEELNPSCIDKVCVLEDGSNEGTCEFIQRYRDIMRSSEFSHALIRLFKFQENVSKAPDDVQEDLKAMETRLTLTCMQAIETRLVSITTRESVPESEKEVGCFCQDDRNGFKIMIKHGEGEKNDSILHERLSSFIHKITGRRIDEGKWRFLMMILGVKNPSEISILLDEARIPRSVSNTGKEPCPGETIPEHFHFLLKNDIDYYLRDGELVAYELKEEDENNDAVYVFAKIIEQTNEGEGKYGFDSRYKIDVGQEEPIEVSKLKLYKFDRDGTKVKKGKKTSSTELVLYEGPEGEGESDTTKEEKKTAPKPCNLEEAKKEVAEALKEIWNLPESERSSAIKRLIRRWHPDKNQDCEALANEVTKFLLNEVERLKKGGVPGYTAPGSRRPNSSTGTGSRPRSTWDGPDFSDFFRSYQQRARRQRQRYHAWRGRSQEHAHETEPANKNEAERWMRQAREDFNAARFLFHSQKTSFYTFTCFHCQQAVEKCLKALLFAKGRIKKSDLDTHDVMSYAYCASSEDESLRCLPQLVKDFHSYYTKTRYPEYNRYFPNESIPSEMFTQQNADDALSKTREILQLIRDVLN